MIKHFNSKELPLEDRLDFIEFRQELLFRNKESDRTLFNHNIKRKEYDDILKLMDEYESKIMKNEEIQNAVFEESIYKIVPSLNTNYNFCEQLTRDFSKDKMYSNVFKKLYGHLDKYKRFSF